MANINYSNSSIEGPEWNNKVRQLRQCLEYFEEQKGKMIQMLGGADPGQVASFAQVGSDYGVMADEGVPQNTLAKLTFDELSSMLGAGSDQAALRQFLSIAG